jgi:Spy/CpxP family protein refolding chaperone
MKNVACLCAALLALGSTAALAQSPPPRDFGDPGGGRAWAQSMPAERRGDRPMRQEPPGRAGGLGRAMEELFFPPELVMHNQQAIGLSDGQQETIRAEMQKAMGRFTDLQWQQSAQVESLETLCKKQPVDEKAVLAQLDKLLAIESEIKRLNFASLVRVKNILTPEQQQKLRDLDHRGQFRPGDQMGREGGNGPERMPPGPPGRR